MQGCFLSHSDEGRPSLTAVKEVHDVAVSLHREGAHCGEEVQVSEEVTPVQLQAQLGGLEQSLERGQLAVASGSGSSLSSDVPEEEDKTEERQPCAVLSGAEQPVLAEKVRAHSYWSHMS